MPKKFQRPSPRAGDVHVHAYIDRSSHWNNWKGSRCWSEHKPHSLTGFMVAVFLFCLENQARRTKLTKSFIRTKHCVTGTLSSLSGILSEKRKAPHALKNFWSFMKPENSLLYWQQPTTGPYSEPNDYINTPLTYVYKVYLNILPSHLSRDLASSLLLSVFFRIPNCLWFKLWINY
jgi:hypothetical protein